MSPTTRLPADSPAEPERPAAPSDPEQAAIERIFAVQPDRERARAAAPRSPRTARAAVRTLPPDDQRLRDEARATDSAMWRIVGQMAASLLVYGGLGYLVGRWTGHPILLLFGVLFGLTLSIAYTIHIANRAGRVGRE